jgi:3-methyladenine DNA glycosylase/8-oxoguanine DNA glycosylase
VPAPIVTWITPPPLASLDAEREQLEFSSRSLLFARDGDRLLRAWGPPDRPWVLGLGPDGRRWRVEAWGAAPSAARAAARAVFSLDHPIERFYRIVRDDPVLRGTERRFRGLRIPRDPTVYESLVHAVIGQQLSVASANAVQRRLFGAMAPPLAAGGIEVPRVPPPVRLARLGETVRRTVGLSRAKAASLARLGAWASAAISTESRLAALPLPAAIAELDALPGVGRWTAENALLRGVGRTDVFVAGDLGIRVALERFARLPRDAPEERARAWADRRYPGWGSYATFYLWRRWVTEGAASAG